MIVLAILVACGLWVAWEIHNAPTMPEDFDTDRYYDRYRIDKEAEEESNVDS